MMIRIAGLDDFSAVEALLARSYPVMMATAYEERVLARALLLMTKAKVELLASGTFYIVEDEGHVVGCGGWTSGAPGSGETVKGLAHLRHFAVDPARARHGIGRAIFTHCARTASAQGAVRFQAFSGLNAEPFYARMGLVRLKAVSIPMGSDVAFPAVLMEGPVGGRP